MRFIRWVIVGITLLSCPTFLHAAPILVVQETSRQPAAGNMVSIAASLSLDQLNGIHAIEVRAVLPTGQGESMSLAPQAPIDGGVLFPCKRLGGVELFAFVVPAGMAVSANPGTVSLGSMQCVAAGGEGNPSLTALAVMNDGSRIEVPVTYQRALGRGTDIPTGPRLLIVPNPSQSAIDVRFRVETRTQVNVSVYDPRGRLVRNLLSGNHEAGDLSLHWDGRDNAMKQAPLGVYFLRVQRGGDVRTERLVLVR